MTTLITQTPSYHFLKSTKFPSRMPGLHYKDSLCLMYLQRIEISPAITCIAYMFIENTDDGKFRSLQQRDPGHCSILSELGWVLLSGCGERDSKSFLVSGEPDNDATVATAFSCPN